MRVSIILHGFIAFLWFASSSNGQLPQVEDSRLGVDAVRLVGGKRLYGFVLQQTPGEGLTMAVERAWLETTYPELYEQYAEREAEQRKALHATLVERIQDWIEQREGDRLLLGFLKRELAQIEQESDSEELPTFFSVTIAAKDIRKVLIQEARRRHIAGLAYQHYIANVVQTPAGFLRRRLEEADVDVTKEQVNLLDRMPKFQHESSRQWAARQALVEYELREPLEYQGTGTLFTRVGDEPDPQALIAQMLGGNTTDTLSQLGAELGLPEFKKPAEPTDWWKKVTKEAEKDGFRGVLVLRLIQNLLSPEVVVEAHFYAQEAPGKWFEGTNIRASSNANHQPAEALERIKQDPQVAKVVETLSSLGIQAGDRIDQAIRHGAATSSAMSQASGSFHSFLRRYTTSLRTPPVSVH